MSASRRAPKTRYVLTSDRDRIAMVAGASCGFVVLAISAYAGHQVLAILFRAMVAMVVTYAAAYVVVLMVVHLRATQTREEDAELEPEVEEPETE